MCSQQSGKRLHFAAAILIVSYAHRTIVSYAHRNQSKVPLTTGMQFTAASDKQNNIHIRLKSWLINLK